MQKTPQINQTFNGYTNRETWIVSLWVNNDPFINEHAKECAKDSPDSLKQWVEDFKDDQDDTHGLFSDLLSQSLSRVNWQEVADSLLVD